MKNLRPNDEDFVLFTNYYWDGRTDIVTPRAPVGAKNVFVRMKDIWVKNYLLLVVLIPGCDSCDNVIMSRISERSQETSASEARHFVCRTELTNVCHLVFQDISSLFVNFRTTLLSRKKV